MLGEVLANLIFTTKDKERDNVIELHLAVAQTYQVYAAEVYTYLPRNIFECSTQHRYSVCGVLLDLVDKTLQLPGLLDVLSVCCCHQSIVCLCYLLNSVYFNLSGTAADLRSKCVQLIRQLRQAACPGLNLEPLLLPELRSYFIPDQYTNLRDVVQNLFSLGSYSGEQLKSYVPDPDTLMGELLTTLTYFTKPEYPILAQVLKHVCLKNQESDPDLEALKMISNAVCTLFSLQIHQAGLYKVLGKLISFLTPWF